jgi:predicted nucleic acid-binding protein
MAVDALIDTGAMLAILDKSDQWHASCLATVRQLRLPLLTSEAALAELFHMVGDSPFKKEATWEFLLSGTILLGSIQHSELPGIRSLMSRYADRPMDFADATLVYLAERESLETILTVDQTDFSVYRIEGKRHFRVLPIERP